MFVCICWFHNHTERQPFVYNISTGKNASGCLREKCRQCDISPFTTAGREVRYLDVYTISTRNKGEPEGPKKQLTIWT